MRFLDFKKQFYQKVEDLSLFDCQEFNITKVVLDGLIVDYASKGKIRTPFFYPTFLYSFYLKIQQVRNKVSFQMPDFKGKRILVFDTPRAVKSKEGHMTHFRYHRILEYYGPEQCALILARKDPLFAGQIDYVSLRAFLACKPLSHEDLVLRKSLLQVYDKIKKAGVFNAHELKNIAIAIHLFYEQYRVWNQLLKNTSFEKAHFDGHYHREGFMLALKRNKIHAHELQHGIIAPEDIFYVFPDKIKKVAHKALFPDKIFVYGDYWKKTLEQGFEFTSDQIKCIGDYQYYGALSETDALILKDWKKEEQLILVTTQTYLHQYFIAYVQFLHQQILTHQLPYKILLKIHPHEQKQTYASLLSLERVFFTESPVQHLFPLCSMQVSIYSTTLFEALSYKVSNFSLMVEECMDYVQHLIQQEISIGLPLNQCPWEMPYKAISDKSKYFYAPFTAEILDQ